MEPGASHGERSDRISTGIIHLDKLTHGGFLPGRTYLVSGAPGTCKTTFALQFLMAGLAARENCVYVCVNEKPDDIILAANNLGWDIDSAVAAGKAQFLDMSPFFSRSAVINHNRYERRGTDINIRKFMVDLNKYAQACSAKRLIIDSINLILPGIQETRAATSAREFVISIEQYLSCTSLLTFDYWNGGATNAIHPIESNVSGVVKLSLDEGVGCFERHLSIKKMRATDVRPVEYKFSIKPGEGISIFRGVGGMNDVFTDGNGGGAGPAQRHDSVQAKAKGPILLKD